MNMARILDDLLQHHHHRLSIMALHGHQRHGRGAIPLLVEPGDQPHAPKLLRLSIHPYRSLTSYQEHDPELDLDLTFFQLLQSYNPAEVGVIVFQLAPAGLAGFVDFALAPSAKAHYRDHRLPIDWANIRFS